VLAADWAAFGVALAALIWTIAWATLQHFRNRVRDQRVTALQQAQASALAGIEHATQAGIDPAVAHALGAAISIRLQRSQGPTESISEEEMHLILENLGPGGAQIRSVKLVGSEERVFDEARLLPAGPAELLPGEAMNAFFRFWLVKRWPVEIVVRWLDGTGQERERSRHLSFPP
jgi:hypothetical protein